MTEGKGAFCFKQHFKNKYFTCMDKDKGRRQEEVSDGLRKELAEFFRPHNAELFKMIGRSFSWY